MKRLAAIAGAAVIILSVMVVPAAGAAQPRDCDVNAVVYCGAYTKAEMARKMRDGDGRNSAGNLQQIMYRENRGITAGELDSAAAVDGYVGRDGRVVVGGRTVAIDARSVGRVDMPGSRRDGSVFIRPTSVSMRSEQLPAFVYMPGGQFKWAIIKSCGNPVKAQPVVSKKRPKPVVVTEPKPEPEPEPEAVIQIEKSVRNETREGGFADADTRDGAVVVRPGDVVSYRVTVANSGDGALVDGELSDALPAGLEEVTNGDAVSAELTSRSWPVDAVPPGQSVVVRTARARVTSTQDGDFITNRACVRADNARRECDEAVLVVENPVGGGEVEPEEEPERVEPVQPVEPEPVLPETGPLAGLGGLAGMGALGYSVRGYLRSRRSLGELLRRRA